MGFINRPQEVFLRKALFQVHLWAGVIAGLYMVAISLSGSILVFETEWMDHRPPVASKSQPRRIDYSTVVHAAQDAFGGESLASVDMRTRDRRVATVVLKAGAQQRTVYVDTASNRVIGAYIQERRHGLLLWVEDFHNELAGGRNGGVANGIGGAVLAILCATGLVIWWPGIKTWRRALAVNWSARWIRINYDLHSAVGFWTLLLVTMWGVTGAYFIFPQQVQAAFGLFQSAPATAASTWKPGQKILPAGAYVEAAKKRVKGDQKLAFLYMDVFRQGGQVTVFLSPDPAVPLTLSEELVHMDPATAQVLQVEGIREWSTAERLLMATYSIHFGDFGGRLTKLLWVVLGLTPAVLAVSGYLMWWNRYLSKRWRAVFPRRRVLPAH